MRNNTNLTNKHLKGIIDRRVTCGYINVSTPMTYPYATFEHRPLSTSYGRTQETLEINIFSKQNSEVEELADLLEADLDHYEYLDEHISICTYKGQRQNVQDEDKSIKRVRLLMELITYSRES